jgi:hypothetical protein
MKTRTLENGSVEILSSFWQKIVTITFGNLVLSLTLSSGSMASNNDPKLDWDHDKRTVMHLATAKLEQKLRYWREKEQEEILKRYRLITSI